MERARRTMRMTTRVSPGWMKSRMTPCSGRLSGLVPLPVSVLIKENPAASSAETWAAAFWSEVENLEWPMRAVVTTALAAP